LKKEKLLHYRASDSEIEFISTLVESGLYRNTSDAIRDALRKMRVEYKNIVT